MRGMAAPSPSGKQAVTNWPGISYKPLSSVYLQPPAQEIQGVCRPASGQRAGDYFTGDVKKKPRHGY